MKYITTLLLFFAIITPGFAKVIHCPESINDPYFNYFKVLYGKDSFKKENFSYAQSLLGGLTVKCVYSNVDRGQTHLVLDTEKVQHTKAQDVNCFDQIGNPHGCDIDVTILS